jgi:Fe2+ or Zn2+ uptake regulation protein
MTPRRTRQLDAVLDVVRVARDHPTADQVHDRVRLSVPRVSLGTVYRNLEKLAADGDVRVLHLAGRQSRFDGMTTDHDHFVCDACGGVSDLAAIARPPAGHTRLSAEGYEVRTQTQTFFGTCPGCRAVSAAVR